MQPLVMTRDVYDEVMEGVQATDSVTLVMMTGGTSQTVVVPTNAKKVLFSATSNFMIRYASGTLTSATVITPPTFSSSGAGTAYTSALELNPSLRTLAGVTVMTVFPIETGYLTMSWFG